MANPNLQPEPFIKNNVPSGSVPYANQNPGTDYYRMYDPTGWVQSGNTTGKLGSYSGPVTHQTVPFGTGTAVDPSAGFNQVMMEISQHFEPMIQMSVLAQPRWWHDRIPRSSFPLFNGAVHETRVFRGGLMKYAGLDEWVDIDPYPSAANNPCGALPYNTYKYGWEALSWRGKKSAWGSDPICADQFKFMDQAQQQLAWILSTGAEYGIQMQEVWNRDMFIYQSVAFGRSYVMSSEYHGPTSAKYYYDPFVKFAATGYSSATHTANSALVDKPFIVIPADVEVEPINFDVLDTIRESLKVRCPQAAVSRASGDPIFALAVSQDDVERYIRGNQEERKYWIEANPQALIQHYGFAPTTFRRWVITNDGNQLRFKLHKYEASYNPENYGGVASDLSGKAVWIAKVVEPLIASTTRVGVNNTVIPEDNPEYYTAELAIAPIFMNQVFTNQFVPSVSTLGTGTSFGPVTGLNGNWGWLNIQTPDNPFRNRGNFYGQFEIVPKPETHVVHATSFLYRRCTKALKSLCPVENAKINPSAKTSTTLSHDVAVAPGAVTAEVMTKDPFLAVSGDVVTLKYSAIATFGSWGALSPATVEGYTLGAITGSGDTWALAVTPEGGSETSVTGTLSADKLTVTFKVGATGSETDVVSTRTAATYDTAVDKTAYVVSAPTQHKLTVQFEAITGNGGKFAKDSAIVIA